MVGRACGVDRLRRGSWDGSEEEASAKGERGILDCLKKGRKVEGVGSLESCTSRKGGGGVEGTGEERRRRANRFEEGEMGRREEACSSGRRAHHAMDPIDDCEVYRSVSHRKGSVVPRGANLLVRRSWLWSGGASLD